ncbi:hypothetical protein G3M48_001385 [Beauveria asiatica]|uniref:Amino acid transporter transmembrane domain-containing protein n=1 Tax=Beauveria asiatica TaxID=1069075 RepID=A0AAW0RZD1_9HYPO
MGSNKDKTEHSDTGLGQVVEGPDPDILHDEVFGTITDQGPNYRNVGWLGSAALMMKSQIGLGVLSIPGAFDTLGLIPGVLCLLAVAAITTWSNYIVGVFKLNHPEIYGVADVGAMISGRLGREVLGVGFALYLTFGAGSGMLGASIGFNAVSTHGTCTAVFVAVTAMAVICLSSIRTLGRLSLLAWGGLISLLVAVTIVTIAVGIQERPDAAPQQGSWTSDYKLFGSPSFSEAISAITTFIFAYAGTPLFFSIVSEMRDPRLYAKALTICQIVVTITYVTVGIVVYYSCGSYVASPALGSAGKTVKQISYGIALPGLVVGATLFTHMASKYIFVRILAGSRHLTTNTLVHWGTWLGCTFSVGTAAYIVASGIPAFGKLVSLIGALLGTLQSFQPMGCMWLYDNWSKGRMQEHRSRKWTFMVAWSIFVIVLGNFLMVAGTYGSVVGIIQSYGPAASSRPWSCADNSNST